MELWPGGGAKTRKKFGMSEGNKKEILGFMFRGHGS
jgi:hypothetical protein